MSDNLWEGGGGGGGWVTLYTVIIYVTNTIATWSVQIYHVIDGLFYCLVDR